MLLFAFVIIVISHVYLCPVCHAYQTLIHSVIVAVCAKPQAHCPLDVWHKDEISILLSPTSYTSLLQSGGDVLKLSLHVEHFYASPKGLFSITLTSDYFVLLWLSDCISICAELSSAYVLFKFSYMQSEEGE